MRRLSTYLQQYQTPSECDLSSSTSCDEQGSPSADLLPRASPQQAAASRLPPPSSPAFTAHRLSMVLFPLSKNLVVFFFRSSDVYEQRASVSTEELKQRLQEEEDAWPEPASWKPDHLAHQCGACAVKFSLFNRKHHCRSCGGTNALRSLVSDLADLASYIDIFCEGCSKRQIFSNRVCDPCWHRLSEFQGTKGMATPPLSRVQSMSEKVFSTSPPRTTQEEHTQCTSESSHIPAASTQWKQAIIRRPGCISLHQRNKPFLYILHVCLTTGAIPVEEADPCSNVDQKVRKQLEKREKKRRLLVQEIFETERKYMSDLKLIIDVRMNCFENHAHFFSLIFVFLFRASLYL